MTPSSSHLGKPPLPTGKPAGGIFSQEELVLALVIASVLGAGTYVIVIAVIWLARFFGVLR